MIDNIQAMHWSLMQRTYVAFRQKEHSDSDFDMKIALETFSTQKIALEFLQVLHVYIDFDIITQPLANTLSTEKIALQIKISKLLLIHFSQTKAWEW